MSDQAMEFAPSVDFKQKIGYSGKYLHVKMLPQTGGSAPTLNATAEVETVFDLPSSVIYLGKSSISFTLSVAASATLTPFIRADFPPFSRVYLRSRTGKEIVRLDPAEKVWQTSVRACESGEDYISNAPIATNTTEGTSFGRCVYNNPGKAVGATAARGQTINRLDQAGAIQAGDAQAYADYHDQVQLLTGPAHNTNEASLATFRVDLGKYADTFFGSPRPFYATENLQLVMTWAPCQEWIWQGTAIANPATGAESVVPTVSRYQLNLAVEQDLSVINSVQSRVLGGGLRQVMPYVTIHQQSLGAAGAQSTLVKINRAHGQRLLRVYSGIFRADSTLNDAQNAYNVGAGIVSQQQTFMNSKALQTEAMRYDGDRSFWNHIADRLRGSSFGGLPNVLSLVGSLYIDDWSDSERCIDNAKHNLLASGVDLNVEQQYMNQVTSVLANAVQYYIIIGQKTLISDANGVDVI